MAENSAIEWTNHTFNPWIGCTKVSPGCDHCYAEAWANRYRKGNLWRGQRQRTSVANWRKPLAWNRDAETKGIHYRVFCSSLADVFDNQAPEEWRADLFDLIFKTPNLDWLLLTKRPQNIHRMIPSYFGRDFPNVWLGTTVENQAEADRRIPHLLNVPARVHFLSCEPLLGPVDLTAVNYEHERGFGEINPLTGVVYAGSAVRSGPTLDWIICGGESGPGARIWPGFYDAARSLRDQCRAAGVPFFMKQTQGVTKRSMPPIPDDLMVREFPHAA